MLAAVFGGSGWRVPAEEREAASALIARVGVESIEDFAFCFVSPEQARDAGVLEAWSLARRLARLPAAELRATVEGIERSAAAAAGPPTAVSARALDQAAGAARAKRRPPSSAIGGRAALPFAEEDAGRRERTATLALGLSLSWAPRFGLARGLPAAEAQALAAPGSAAAKRLARFEPANAKAALRIWSKWAAWVAARGGCALGTEFVEQPVVIDEFIQAHARAPTSARRIWTVMAWMVNNLRAPFALDTAFRPPPKDPSKGCVEEPRQATVLEPEMLYFLPALLDEAVAEKTHDRLAVASTIAVVYGWARYGHLLPSRPIQRTEHVMWLRSYRGKQKQDGVRAPFEWCIPRESFGASSAADVIWDEWHRRADACAAEGSEAPAGISFHAASGGPIPIAAFNELVRSRMACALQSADERGWVSSYSLRRSMPTFASCLGLSESERCLAGGWAESRRGQGGSAMPLRYDGRRRDQEAVLRVFMARALLMARAAIPSPVRWQHVRAWAENADTRRLLAQCRADAAELIAQSGLPEIAGHMPNGLRASLRRRRFGLLQKAPQAAPRTVSAPAASEGTEPAPVADPAPSSDGELTDVAHVAPTCVDAQRGGAAGHVWATPGRGEAAMSPTESASPARGAASPLVAVATPPARARPVESPPDVGWSARSAPGGGSEGAADSDDEPWFIDSSPGDIPGCNPCAIARMPRGAR